LRESKSELVVRRWGSGPAVVLVHGAITGAHASWAPLRAHLPGWTLLAPNRRGYHPRTPAEHEDYLTDANDVVDLLDEPAHMVGHSYGAVVALVAATQVPHQLRSLTLVEPPPLPDTHHLPVVRNWLERMNALRTSGPAESGDFLRRFMAMVGVPDDTLDHADQLTEQIRLLRTSRPAWTADVDVDAIVRLRVPVLVVSGGHSPVFEVAADHLAIRLHAQRLTLATAGHFVQRDPRFVNALSRFLQQHREQQIT
jgi:pimeloyl-ACP methyl ester carboxylesterase